MIYATDTEMAWRDDPATNDWDFLDDCTHRPNTSCEWACPTWGRERRRERRHLNQSERLRRKRARHRNDVPWLVRNEPWRVFIDEAPF